MIILAFILSILVFCISELLITIISLSFYTLLVGSIQKKIIGYSDANVHSLNQFLSAGLGVFISSYIGYSVATWVEANVNLNVLFVFYCTIYYLMNFYTKGAIKPWAQKIGALLGFSISYVVFNLI